MSGPKQYIDVSKMTVLELYVMKEEIDIEIIRRAKIQATQYEEHQEDFEL